MCTLQLRDTARKPFQTAKRFFHERFAENHTVFSSFQEKGLAVKADNCFTTIKVRIAKTGYEKMRDGSKLRTVGSIAFRLFDRFAVLDLQSSSGLSLVWEAITAAILVLGAISVSVLELVYVTVHGG